MEQPKTNFVLKLGNLYCSKSEFMGIFVCVFVCCFNGTFELRFYQTVYLHYKSGIISHGQVNIRQKTFIFIIMLKPELKITFVNATVEI